MSLADLQKHLSIGMVNPEPPDLMIGETVFCTFRNFDRLSNDKYMWVCVLDNAIDVSVSPTRNQYQINVEGEGPVWVEAKFFWTKTQVQKLAGETQERIPRWENNLILPEGMKVRDPNALAQAVLNLLRDVDIKGRAGYTNLPAVRCNVEGMTLGHFYKIGEALGEDVCNFLNEEKERLKK